jgi:hypothetical protein
MLKFPMTVIALAAYALTTSPHQAKAQTPEPLSDNFTMDEALKEGWILFEPNRASYCFIGTEGLVLGASGENGGSDLWSGTNYNASLLLQPISPEANWTIIVHFFFSPVIDVQAAGIILTAQINGFTSASSIHRFELSYQNGHHGLAISSYTNGPIDPDFAPYIGKEVYLKLTKVGSKYWYSYSARGKHWILLSTIIDPAAYRYVGLDSIRQPWHGYPTMDSQPVFESFNIQVAR